MTTNSNPVTQSPIFISAVRTFSPVLVAAVVALLAHANVHVDVTWLNAVITTAITSAAATAYVVVGRWLETNKNKWWGKLFFFIAKAPTYDPPAPAPVLVTTVTSNSGNSGVTLSGNFSITPPTDPPPPPGSSS